MRPRPTRSVATLVVMLSSALSAHYGKDKGVALAADHPLSLRSVRTHTHTHAHAFALPLVVVPSDPFGIPLTLTAIQSESIKGPVQHPLLYSIRLTTRIRLTDSAACTPGSW